MKYPFPNQNKTYIQNNRSNILPIGNLWSTFNTDFQTNLGVMRIYPRLKLSYSTADDADLGCPWAFHYFDGKLWAGCGAHIFHNAGLPDSTPWTDDASTGVATDYSSDYSDMAVFNNTLCAATTDELLSKARNGSGTGAWTSRDTLSGSSIHVMTYFKRFDRLYYANGIDSIISIDTAWATADPGSDYAISLTFNSVAEIDYEITSMRATNTNIWIGTINRQEFESGLGKLVQWDGLSAQITAEFELNNANGVMAIAIDPQHDNPFVMDSNGVLSEFNGTGFNEVARLPLPFNKMLLKSFSNETDRFIHPNGMYFTRNGTLRMNINNAPSTGDIMENMPSGVWEWSRETGLVHLTTYSYNPVASSVVTDYGQNMISRVGAISSMQSPFTSSSDGTFLAGATIYTNATTTTSGIFFDNSLDTIIKKGYFVTDWFESREIADSWDIWWASFRKFLATTDDIVFKYRIEEEAPVVGAITWVNTTSFTVTNAICDVSDYWTSGTGGEVEILRGTGGGLCAHITNAVLAAGTWTVTIDETATGVTTGTATARFQKWIKVYPAEDLSSVSTWGQWSISTDSTPRIQIKGCFTYTGAGEFYKAILTSEEDIKSN